MKIAVCDDDRNDIAIINSLIKKYDPDLSAENYCSAEELLDGLNEQWYDLIFLDIQMKTLNGFEAAKLIVERYEDKAPLIVFTTNSSQYTLRGYEVAFRYLIKPVGFEDISNVLSSAKRIITPKVIELSYYGKSMVITVDDICYCEVFGHNTIVHTKENTYECRYPLKKVEEMLQGVLFFRPHVSYIINMTFVQNATQGEILLKNGMKIKISRHKKKDFTRLFHQYLRR